MHVSSYSLTPYPGYEDHVAMTLKTDESKKTDPEYLRKIFRSYQLSEGMTMEDIQIPGTEEGQTIRLRVFKPAGLTEAVPVIMDVHGGGFTSGSLDIDNYRCISLAELSGCIVVSVEYRLASETVHFPAPLLDCHTAYIWLTQNAQPLMDCYAALNWLGEHASELGGDPKRIALHGTSAGGNLCAALALYVRDHGGPELSLVALNCPVLSMENTFSKRQYPQFALGTPVKREGAEWVYLGGFDGNIPSYYAFPGYCTDLDGLPPHYIVVGEYDTLRDDGINYAVRLLQTGVPCELVVAPRVGHGFCVVDHPLTHWVHKGICGSMRREFGMEISEF